MTVMIMFNQHISKHAWKTVSKIILFEIPYDRYKLSHFIVTEVT